MDLKGFKNPNNIMRPAPFWAINERITPEETARQMADMISVGLSGGFFHSRAGLVTEYMGEDWFASMNAAIDVANDKDGYLWLYDEDLWPSGNAGGQVAGMKDEYRSAVIGAYIVAPGEPEPEIKPEHQEIRRCYIIKSREGLSLKEYEDVPLDKIGDYKDFERFFLIRTYTDKIGWWSGESYANLLHPEAMQEFIKLTHERYFSKLGSEFGKRVPGIFTDEPQVAFGWNCLAWYEGIPSDHKNWHSRDFWKDILWMFFEGPEARKARLLVNRTVHRRFLESYSKPIFEWCEKHGIEHTGHYNAEDAFYGQIMCHCGSVMSHYKYQQAPGIDHLCREVQSVLFTCRQVSSAARQLGRSRVLTEIFGVSRHTNTFEDFKWIGDYDLVHGANFFCPHLTWYSAKGRRKRDYPPVWNYQQTYWKYLNPLNDYFTRVAHALTRGKAVSDIVILQSIESAIAQRRLGAEVRATVEDNARKVPVDGPHEDSHATHYYDGQMRKALEGILNAGYECDIGEEGYIEDMGKVEGDSFIIGQMSYKVVVLPMAMTWRPKTFELLKQFVANGGKVVIMGNLPVELDADKAEQAWIEFAEQKNVFSIPSGVTEIQDKIDEIAPQTYTLKGSDGKAVPNTYLHHRIDGGQEIFFIVNSDRNKGNDYTLTFLNGKGKQIVKWDAVEGTCELISQPDNPWGKRYDFHLPPSGSLLITLGGDVQAIAPEHAGVSATKAMCAGTTFHAVPLPEEFDFERLDPNVLVMDKMSVSYDGGKSFEAANMDWRTRRAVAKHFGTEAALEWQPWVAIRKGLFDGKGGEIILRYSFASDLDKPKAYAVIEDISKGQLSVNGTSFDTSNPAWQWDRGFGKVEITDAVKKGENIVDFKVNYDFLTEVEPAYIVGEFGVEMMDPFAGKLVEEPKKLKTGPWTDQGYPFYSGKMVYKTEFDAAKGKQTFLRLLRPSGILYKAKVNGQDAGEILWRPWELDITSLVQNGKNTIEIEVVSSLQNSWGPLHEKEGDDNRWCGPNAFEDEWMLREEFNLFPYGLLGGAEIVTF